MTTITRFEEIEAWQSAFRLASRLYRITASDQFREDWGLRDQIRRAGVSVMANIAEGFERRGDKEFIHFLSIGKGSVGEVRSHLHIALGANYINGEEFSELYSLSEEVSQKIGGFMKYLKEASHRAKATK